MNSFFEANEQTVVDFNSINPKLREHSKTYSFFIYFLRKSLASNSTHLQKLAFRLKQEKGWGWEKQQNGRLIQLFFVDLDNEQEVDQSFFDLKMQLLQSIFFLTHTLKPTSSSLNSSKSRRSEHRSKPSSNWVILIRFIGRSVSAFRFLKLYAGWLDGQLGDLSQKSSSQFQSNVKKWISSPSQKIDLWEVTISVDQREGSIFKLDQESNTFNLLHHKEIKENFLSHLSIGHHSQLAANYESNHKQKTNSVVNQCIFNFQSFKKFCCLGSPSLEASTGIVSMNFQDEKGATQQITKELMQAQSKKGVMTLVFSNIDRFQGLKLKGGRMNDGRLEIGVFQSRDQYRMICPASQINLKFKAQQIFVQVNSSCLRLLCPKEMKIALQRKMKVIINKETLEC